ncbi:MAG: hypothetical protein IT289_09070 [Oligoflexia bacterium]|nr:hypothetical protein [Oligoflexia bacterium]
MKLGRSTMIFIVCLALSNMGGCNLFTEMSDKTSDEVISDDVVNLIDRGLWNDAILKWNTLSPAAQAKRENKVLLASAYAGRGRLDTLAVISSLNTNASGADLPLFAILMTAFKRAQTYHFDDQTIAEQILTSIGPNTSRTIDENILMAFVAMAKIGTLMAAIADTDGDGVVDGGFDNCTDFTNTQSAHIVTAVSNLLLSLQASGTTIANSSVDDLSSNCAAIDPTFCEITDVNSVTALQIRASNTLAGENNLNIGLEVRSGSPQYEFTDPCPSCPGGSVAAAPPPNNLCP